MDLKNFFTLDVNSFSHRSGIGITTIRAMIADGRLEAVRIGKKKLLVVVQSYLDYLEKEAAKGTPEYEGVKAAHAARKRQIEDGLRRPGPGLRAEARQEKLTEAEALLDEIGLLIRFMHLDA
jgi:hypothetical protein